MTPADFRRIALSFEGAEEGSHMGAADFRVGGRIFATLASVKARLWQPDADAGAAGGVYRRAPDLFLPVHGGWGRTGVTHIRLALADEDILAGALYTAWKLRIEKNGKAGTKPGSPAPRRQSTKPRPAKHI